MNSLYWILFLPLLAFIIQIFFGRKLPKGGDWLCTSFMGIAFILSLGVFIKVLKVGEPNWFLEYSFEWLRFGSETIFLGIKIDNLSAIMLVVVTLISFLVHLFSMEYMSEDPRYSRYFGYLGLFSFSMLGIVLSDNLLGIYVFWELVGVSSYLLIGFWFEKNTAANACKKAFITNRIGDVGMFIGIMILFMTLKTFHLGSIQEMILGGQLSGTLLTIAGLCLFCGAIGKSAQFPLHVWLPDAMEGPTPVSALIHAATMVAAGVYLVARIFFMLTPDALIVIAYIGTITLFLGSTIALVQNDIKKVLAYSTISQLGYMIMGLGVGAYVASFFHLVTHAAFKACLFLGSGSVIHAMHHAMDKMNIHDDPQDMKNMGGLKRKLPITYATFLIATLALSGIPFTSGFLSKDAILAQSLNFFSGHHIHFLIPLLGFLSAGMTAFYMFRLVFKTFFGEYKYGSEEEEHLHDSGLKMVIPLIILAILSFYIFYTFPGFSPFSAAGGWFYNLIHQPESVSFVNTGHHSDSHMMHYIAMIVSIVVAACGIVLAYLMYYKNKISPEKLANRFPNLYTFLLNKWNFDVIYSNSVVKMTGSVSEQSAAFDQAVIDGAVNDIAKSSVQASRIHGWFDKYIVDGLVNASAWMIDLLGWFMRLFQTGRIQTYLFLTVLGFVGSMSLLFWVFN